MFRNTIFLLLLFLKLILNEYFPLSLFYFYRLKIGIYYSFLFLNKSFFLSLSRDLKSTLKNFLIFCVARGLYIDLCYFQVFKFKNRIILFSTSYFLYYKSFARSINRSLKQKYQSYYEKETQNDSEESIFEI